MPLNSGTELRGDERFPKDLVPGDGYRFVTIDEAEKRMPDDAEFYYRDSKHWTASDNRGKPIPAGDLGLPYRTKLPAIDNTLATIARLVGA